MAESFKDAFAAARKSGVKEFTWKGNKYHTRTKEEDNKRAAATKPVQTSGKMKVAKTASPKPKVDRVPMPTKPSSAAPTSAAAKRGSEQRASGTLPGMKTGSKSEATASSKRRSPSRQRDAVVLNPGSTRTVSRAAPSPRRRVTNSGRRGRVPR
jgi:hypothetical protein